MPNKQGTAASKNGNYETGFCLVLFPCISIELLGQILSANWAVLCNSTTSEENAVNPPRKPCLALDVTTSARDVFKRLKQPTLPVRQGKCRFCAASRYPEGKAGPYGPFPDHRYQAAGAGAEEGCSHSWVWSYQQQMVHPETLLCIHSAAGGGWGCSLCCSLVWGQGGTDLQPGPSRGWQLTPRLGDHRLWHSLPEEAVLASSASCH